MSSELRLFGEGSQEVTDAQVSTLLFGNLLTVVVVVKSEKLTSD